MAELKIERDIFMPVIDFAQSRNLRGCGVELRRKGKGTKINCAEDDVALFIAQFKGLRRV